MPFIKLDSHILTSTLWIEKDARDVFITALLMAEPWEFTEPMEQIEVRNLNKTGFVVPAGWYGFVRAAGVGIVRTAMIGAEEGYKALEILGNEDPESRSDSFGGRRLVRVDGGYIVLNYMKFRDFDYTAKERMQRLRDRKKGVTRNDRNVHPNVTHSRQQRADASVVDDVDEGQTQSGSCVPPKELPGEPSPICSAEAAKFMKTFGPPEAEPVGEFVPSARILELAAVFGQRMKEPQALDFNSVVLERVGSVEQAPHAVVLDALKFVSASDYWLTQMSNEDAGRGALKVFIRGFAKICEFAKSAGTGKKKTYTAKAKPPVYKASSVAPDPTASTYAPMETY